ncbi:hypothetical protein ACROYT_G020891 [Oculina patagonica]
MLTYCKLTRRKQRKTTKASVTAKKTSKNSKEKPGKKATAGEKPQQKKEKGKVPGSSVERSKLFKPSPSSGPSWSPTPTMRGRKAKTKKSFGASKKLHLESPALPKTTDTSPSAKQLAASVESFANYLKHFVRPEETEPPPARWSDDEPAKSVSRTSFRRPSDEHRLSRERALQAEVENWQLAWKGEKKRNDKLIADVASREKEWSRREEKCRLEYESQIHELKQELFVVQAKLNETEIEADTRKRVAAGGNLEGASEEDLKRLEKEVREQEQLLTGYQQENERLYKELKQMQAKEKANEARMFSENQKLESPLLSSLVAELRPKLTVACGEIANVLSCIAQRPLCHLIMACDQITNFPSYVARRLLSHLIITCDQNTALSSDEARMHGVDDIRADEAIEYNRTIVQSDEAIEYNRTIVQSSKCGTGSILLYNVTKSRRAQSSVQTSINDTHNNYDSKLIKRYERDVRVVAGKNGDRSCSVALISTNAEKSQAVKKATGNETENHLEFLFVELLNCSEERNTEVDLKNY